MEENLMLGAFVLFPILLGIVLYLYFSRIASHLRKIPWLHLMLGNLLVFVFLLSPILLFGEVYYRFFYDKTDSFGLTKVYSEWFRRHYHFNNYGMRDSILYTLKPIGKKRVTFIGDSFTAGHGVANVEDRFANRLRAMRPDLEIHVFAVNGWDTEIEMVNLQKMKQDGYQTDQMVLVYTLNDIADLIPEWGAILDRIYSMQTGFLVKHSYFVNTLYFCHFAASDPDISDYYGFVLKAYEGPLWEKQQEHLTLIKDFLAEEGIDFCVVTFPFLQEIGPDYPYREIHKRLDGFWKQLGVAHLDLLETYEQFRAEDLIVNRRDPHPNEYAHSIAAEEIGTFLKSQMAKGQKDKD